MSFVQAKSGRWGLECDGAGCRQRFWAQGALVLVKWDCQPRACKQGWHVAANGDHYCPACAPDLVAESVP